MVLGRGLHQGSQLSSIIFLHVAQVFTVKLVFNREISGVNIDGVAILLSLFAEDTDMFIEAIRINDQINPDAVFDCGSLEGLALKLSRNNNCSFVLNDELQTLLELIEGGGKGPGERARFLTLHGGGSWTKTTQSKGNRAINETKVQICAFTQPENMATFGRNKLNQVDGLFSRFLVSVPKDVFLMRKDISEAVTTMPSISKPYRSGKRSLDVDALPHMNSQIYSSEERPSR